MGDVMGGEGRQPIVEPKNLLTKSGSQDLSSAALSAVTAFARKWKLDRVTLHASGAISETIVISIDSARGAHYDTKIKTKTLVSNTDFVLPGNDLVLQDGDEIKITCTNGGGANTAYYEITGEEVF